MRWMGFIVLIAQPKSLGSHVNCPSDEAQPKSLGSHVNRPSENLRYSGIHSADNSLRYTDATYGHSIH